MAGLAAPFDVYRDAVRPEWIDHNGHMNMGYYLVVFDYATDEFFRWAGLDAAHRGRERVTTFCVEAHVTYHREVREGDPLRFTTLLLGHDAKRLHYIHAMYHATEGYLAATNELMLMNIDYASRRSAPWPDFAMERIDKLAMAHKTLPIPKQAGRLIGIKKKK